MICQNFGGMEGCATPPPTQNVGGMHPKFLGDAMITVPLTNIFGGCISMIENLFISLISTVADALEIKCNLKNTNKVGLFKDEFNAY